MYKVFIDGREGTTGLRIAERLRGRKDITLLSIDEDLRKNSFERKRVLNQADYAILCLPDEAAEEAVLMVTNPETKIIDASTAHRTDPKFTYGLPELSPEHRKNIQNSHRVSVPGCYATGFVALMYPIVKNGYAPPYHPVTCSAVSGYSGAGKKVIETYEGDNRPEEYDAPRFYSLDRQHKHIKEMMSATGLSYPPAFVPTINDFYNGMIVTVPLLIRTLSKRVSALQMWELLSETYKSQNFVKVAPFMGEGVLENGFLAANKLKDTNLMQIFVFGNDDHILLAARLDNLGKGASGAAVQCMNIMMGIDETTGLINV